VEGKAGAVHAAGKVDGSNSGMKDYLITIRLSEDEFAFLEEVVAKDKTLMTTFRLQQNGSILVSPKNVEEVRDFLTLQLAATGFDQDYVPNKRGQLIENLIDKLFVV
jgi:hypothetical protein